MSDPINPDHYKRRSDHPSRVECIELIERMPALLANVVKYLYRAGVKTPSPVADLRKAAWYLERATRAPHGIRLTWNGGTKTVRAALVRWTRAPGGTRMLAHIRGTLCTILDTLDGEGCKVNLQIRAVMLRQAADRIERDETLVGVAVRVPHKGAP